MGTILKNVLAFTGLPIAVPVSLPHRLNVNGHAVIPQLVAANAGGFTIAADDVNVTVTRTTGGPAVNIYTEHWHTIEAVVPLPGQLAGLVPFIISGGSGGGGADTDLMTFTVFVAKNGNDGTGDGSVEKPFLTVQAAMEYAWTTYVLPLGPQPTAPFTRPCVFVNAGTYDDGDLILPPQICVMGEGFNHTRITGNWTIDARWSNYVPASLPSPPSVLVPNDFRSSWINIGLFGAIDIDFNTVFSNEGKLYALGCRFAGNVTIAEKRVNPVSNSITFTACESLADVTLIGIPTLLAQHVMRGGTLFITQAIGGVFVDVDNIFESSGGSLGNIVVTSLDATMPPYDCKFAHFAQPETTLTLNGIFSTVKADLGAVPLQGLIGLASSASLNQIIRINQLNWSGVTAQRPPSGLYIGQQYFDTTIIPNRPIWWNGVTWIDAAGVVV
jgi:hypothetical protein